MHVAHLKEALVANAARRLTVGDAPPDTPALFLCQRGVCVRVALINERPPQLFASRGLL